MIFPYQIDQSFPPETPSAVHLESSFLGSKCLCLAARLFSDKVYTEDVLKNHISKIKDLDLIIIDASTDPFWAPNPYQQFDNFILLAKSLGVTMKVLINDYRFYYCTHPDFIYFPTYFWTFSNGITHMHSGNLLVDVVDNKNQRICCLNRNPHPHRILLFNQLVKKSWFKNIAYTFGNFAHNVQYQSDSNLLTKQEHEEFQINMHLLPIKLSAHDAVDQYGIPDTASVGLTHWVYEQCIFNLTTETSVDNVGFCSEKICKPFMANQIPIVLGPPGVSKFCEDIGFDMFSDIVPWNTWDSKTDYRQRITLIVEFLDHLMTQDFLKIYQQCKSRLDQNKKYFHSTEFRTLMMQQTNKFLQGNQ